MANLIDKGAFIEDIKTEIVNLAMDGLKGTPRDRSYLYGMIDRINEQPTTTEAEIRNKAIDEFAEDLIKTFCYDTTENIGMKEKVTFFNSANIRKHILQVAEQLKEE